MEYVATKVKAAAIRKVLVAKHGRDRVSVKCGTGTASSWIHADLEINRPEDYTCGKEYLDGFSYSSRDCEPCRQQLRKWDEIVNRQAHEALDAIGAKFSTFYSDDGYDTERECFIVQVRFIKAEATKTRE